MKIKNVSPLGPLEVPELGLIVEPGEAVEVPDEHAAGLLSQTGTWAPAKNNTTKEA